MVFGLGGAWILKGLQITVASSGWRESRPARIGNGAADQLQPPGNVGRPSASPDGLAGDEELARSTSTTSSTTAPARSSWRRRPRPWGQERRINIDLARIQIGAGNNDHNLGEWRWRLLHE